jgi:uncharacterized membrane protein
MVSPFESLPPLSNNLHDDHVRREADRAFADGLGDADIKIHLLLEGEIMVNNALRQTLELEVTKMPSHSSSVRLRKMSDLALWMSQPPPK